MESSDLIFLTSLLISLSLVFQSLELIILRKTFSEEGIWRWSSLKKEFQDIPLLSTFLNYALQYQCILFLLYLRIALSIILPLYNHYLILLSLLIIHILLCIRWRGSIYGGSDYMSIIILCALSISSFSNDSIWMDTACLVYIGLQSILSYFISGIVKINKKNWRSGKALEGFLLSPSYIVPEKFKKFAFDKPIMISLSWFIMLFEISFPLALFDPNLCLTYLSIAATFHLINVYIFGLNHFFFVWLASYPGIWAMHKLLSST